MVTLVITVLFALGVSFLCAASEAVILSITHGQIQSLGKTRAAEIMRRFKREIDIPNRGDRGLPHGGLHGRRVDERRHLRSTCSVRRRSGSSR